MPVSELVVEEVVLVSREDVLDAAVTGHDGLGLVPLTAASDNSSNDVLVLLAGFHHALEQLVVTVQVGGDTFGGWGNSTRQAQPLAWVLSVC